MTMNRALIAAIAITVIIVGAGTGAAVYLATRSSQPIMSASDSNNSQPTNSSQQTLPTSEPTQAQQRITAKNCISDTCLQVPNLNYPVTPINQAVKDTLSKTLDNEYKLQAYYQAVINKFGDQRPFSMIIGAETQHIAVITSLDEKYGLTPVTNQWAGHTFSLVSLQAACKTSASYEQSTVGLLSTLLPQVSNYPDITQVLINIKDASQNNHLPAFEKCS